MSPKINQWLDQSTVKLTSAKAVASYVDQKRYTPMASNLPKGSAMEKRKLRPAQFNVGLGTIEIAQERWEAYEKAAEKAGSYSLSSWARDLLDKEAGFKKK
jgi:hypothetical protein